MEASDELVLVTLPLSEQQAGAILRSAGVDGLVTVTEIKRHNHVFRLDCRDESFFLKCYTKSWYADEPEAPSWCVAHEASAWEVLRARGIAAPEVVAAVRDDASPLGRPYLLTRRLAGRPLTHLLDTAPRSRDILEAAGRYLRATHEITFRFTGYIIGDGPDQPPEDGSWQHRCWTAKQRQRSAFEMLETEREFLPSDLAERLARRFASIAQELAPEYEPPRFTQGDCHAHQIFVTEERGGVRVTGAVDMEVASAGDCVEDLLKVCIELSRLLPSATRWWEPLFEGYGSAADFRRFQLRLLGASSAEFGWMRRGWSYDDRAKLLAHIMDSSNWRELFSWPG